jgi:arylsulfatase A-like enzyme
MRRALLLAAAALTAAAAPAAAQTQKPNVIVIETDDQDAASMKVMEKTNRLIGAAGATFDNNLVSFPLCCPSRATFLTGQYAHNNGITSNDPPTGGYQVFENINALPVWLQGAGYYTALVGRYLNHYGKTNPAEIPPAGASGTRASIRRPIGTTTTRSTTRARSSTTATSRRTTRPTSGT